MAILYREGKYLMQLRDDIPGIVYPGVWGLFGGSLEPGEEPETGLRRELVEEIGYAGEKLTEFGLNTQGDRHRYLFSGALSVPLTELQLNEGWDFKLLTQEEIVSGMAYSPRAGADKPIGDFHRQIMLDFIARANQN